MPSPELRRLPGACWQPRPRLRAGVIPAGLRPWLFDEDSLTRRLVAASHGDFAVQVRRQWWGRARPDEARLLGIAPRHACRLREVLLLGQGQPWVFARSVLPDASLTGRSRFLRRLQSRPLGALLFQSPGTVRTRVEYAPFAGSGFPGNPDGGVVWGRRSVFLFQDKPLLVGEYFLPAVAAQRFPGR